MMIDDSRAGRIPLIGGALCLDFVNTVGNHAGDQPSEWLTTYAELLAWGRRAGALGDVEASVLRKEALRHPKRASRLLERAREIREALFRVLGAVVSSGAIPGGDLK